MKGIRFCATGAALPHNSVSNEALSQRVDTSDDWIRSRTGIAARRIAGETLNRHCVTLCECASKCSCMRCVLCDM